MENQQLIKKDRSANSYSKIFPWTFTDLVLDRVTKESLDNILVRNNFIALPYVGSKAATRLQVPMKNRRRGIWLSYIDYAGTLTVEYYNDNNLDDNHWQDSSYWLPYNTAEFQPASVGLSALAQEVFDWINSQITAAVKLNPEDLQKNSSDQIEEANRAYDTSTFSGLGYRILRKNIQSNKNILTQSMINMPNNVYKIRYDFDLNGATINLPANSVLQFVGGSIKNGTLNGNNTVIEADSNAVIFDSVVIEGTWNVEHIYDSWFAFNTSPSYISNQIITNILALSNDDVYNTIHFDADRTYYFELPYKGRANLGDDVRPNYWKLNTEEYAFLRIFTGVTSNTHLIFNNTLQMIPTNQGAYFIFHIESKENIQISGTGTINADALNHKYTDTFAGTLYYGEWGHIFNFRSCNNIVIKDVTLAYAFGDAIGLGNAGLNIDGNKGCLAATKNVTIDGIKVLYARRNGISLGGNNYSISNVYFEGCGSEAIRGTAPKAAIDFENDYTEIDPSGICTNVVMSNCKFKDNAYDVSSTIRWDLGEVPTGQLVTINGCNFTAPLRLNKTRGLTFNDCHIVGISSHDNSISPWTVSEEWIFNNCNFDELNPYLVVSASDYKHQFNNCTYPEDIQCHKIFRGSLAGTRAIKFSIPKPISVGELEFVAICTNSSYSIAHLPINTTKYTIGNGTNLVDIRDIRIEARVDSYPRFSMYQQTPVFSYIDYNEDADNINIYFSLGGNITGSPLAGNTEVNIFMNSKTKYVIKEMPVSEGSTAGIYGGKWSKVSAITKTLINISEVPSTVVFPSREMYPNSTMSDLNQITNLKSQRMGTQIYVTDISYRQPAYWDSTGLTWRTADGNRTLERRVTNKEELNTLTAKLTESDRGYRVYTSAHSSYLTWDGIQWLNEDGSLYSDVKFINKFFTIERLNNAMSNSNVTYKIVGNIDLDGGTLTIVTGSILDFQGGSFSNGTIIFNSTKLQGNIKINAAVDGNIISANVKPSWFGALEDGKTDDSNSLMYSIKIAKNSNLPVLITGKLYVTKTIDVSGVKIIGSFTPNGEVTYYTGARVGNIGFDFMKNINQGATITFKEMVEDRYQGSCIVSDVANPILKVNKTTNSNIGFNLENIGIIGWLRNAEQVGLKCEYNPELNYLIGNHKFKNILVSDCGNNGVEIQSLEEAIIDNCSFTCNNGYGLYIKGIDTLDTPTEYCQFNNCSFSYNRLDGVCIEDSFRKQVKFYKCLFQMPGQYELGEVNDTYGNRTIPDDQSLIIAGLKILNGALVGTNNRITNGLILDNNYGELIVKAFHLQLSAGSRALNNLVVKDNYFIKLSSTTNSLMLYLHLGYMENPYVWNNQASVNTMYNIINSPEIAQVNADSSFLKSIPSSSKFSNAYLRKINVTDLLNYHDVGQSYNTAVEGSTTVTIDLPSKLMKTYYPDRGSSKIMFTLLIGYFRNNTPVGTNPMFDIVTVTRESATSYVMKNLTNNISSLAIETSTGNITLTCPSYNIVRVQRLDFINLYV
jgi:hypothetical protein